MITGRLIPCVALTLALAGCGESLDRHEVVGQVSLDGNPVKAGYITFEPWEPAPDATLSGAMIQNGQYRVPGGATGLKPGKYRVRLTAYDPHKAKVAENAADEDSEVVRNLMPPEYNTQSTLFAEVKAGGTTEDFHVTTGRKSAEP